jgi:hypothetical protein
VERAECRGVCSESNVLSVGRCVVKSSVLSV